MLRHQSSRLYDQTMFYGAFLRDLRGARRRVIIESPFITKKRTSPLLPTLLKLSNRGVRIVINAKPIEEHQPRYRDQAIWAVVVLQAVGVEVLMTGGHHRKLAIIDDDILWEGSLNITVSKR